LFEAFGAVLVAAALVRVQPSMALKFALAVMLAGALNVWSVA
jgi:hypothetical protein